MELDLTQMIAKFVEVFLTALAPVVASLVTAWLIAKARQAWKEFEAANPDEAWWLSDIAKMAVKAAEQAGAAGYIENKKEYAIDIAEQWLAERGFYIDLNIIDAAIEAAVYDEFQKGK